MTAKFTRINNYIRASQVRLIGADGKQLGVVALGEALSAAGEAGLDLVEVAPDIKPPVCKIMDYSKFKYEQEKREREAKKKQHIVHIKEIKMSPKIEEHDYQTKLNHLRRFLEDKDRAKVTMFFRGREMAHIDIGRGILERLIKDISDMGELEEDVKKEGRFLIMKLKPKERARSGDAKA